MLNLSVLLSAALLLSSQAYALWPIPTTKYDHGTDTIWICNDAKFEYLGHDGKQPRSSRKVLDAWKRTQIALFQKNIVPWKFYPKGTPFEPARSVGKNITRVIAKQTALDPASPVKYEDGLKEGYTLTIAANGEAVYITAASSVGILHALTTLQQLFYAPTKSRSGGAYGTGPIDIIDTPVFQHRGLNLDVARQWYPKTDILRAVDALSWNKMNRLHLHVTDSQSWPLEIPSMPGLAANGAYAPGLTYTPQDLQEILDFAEARAVEVIIEIDMPGHTTSIAETYPDLIVGRNIQPNWDTYAAQPASGSLKLNNKGVYDFLTKLFADLLPRLKKHSHYFHTGGDEVNSNVYKLDPGVGSDDKLKIQPHLEKFFSHVQKQVSGQGMSPFVWEEMLLDWNLTLPDSTIVQTWRSDEATAQVTKKGFRVIAGNYNYWYLDCGQGQWLDFGGLAFQKFYPFNDYCTPRKSWRLIYSYSPTQFLTPEQAKLVLGGEVHIWSEQIDGVSLDVMMWPRTSAAAEALWSGRTDANGVNRTFADASPRLGEMRERMVAKGVGASPVMQLWCHQNKGDCELNSYE